jgi:hypothetical protein
MNLSTIKYSYAIILILSLAFIRLLPHAPNFSPIIAISIYAGIKFNNKYLALVVPIFSMVVSDYFIGFHSSMLAVYFCIILNVFIGIFFSRNFTLIRYIYLSFLGACIFFIITNFSVWLLSNMYPASIEGLASCYILALPFFQNTLVSTLFFGCIIFYTTIIFDHYIDKKASVY